MPNAKTDTEMVIVHLDRVRPYRLRHEDREAVWVGPGEAQVPRWVAEHWGLEPIQPPDAAPEAEPLSLVEVESPPDMVVLVEEEPVEEPEQAKPDKRASTRRKPAQRKKG